MSYDLCLFDLDGTLVDSKEGIIKSYQYALKAFKINKESKDLIKYIGKPLRDIFRENGVNENDIEPVVSKFREYLTETGLFECKDYQGISDLLLDLKIKIKTLAVVTIKVKLYATQTLEYFDLQQYFSYVAGDTMDGSLSKNGKRDLINIALMKLDPGRHMKAVMIGDSKHDILGAKEAGIDSIGVLWGYSSHDELEQYQPTHIVETISELKYIILGK